MVKRAAMFSLVFVFACIASEGRSQDLFYNSSGNSEKQLGFRALKLALEKSGNTYELKPSPVGYPTQDALVDALANGGQIDIGWVGATKSVSERLLAVRFPIDGGLLGYRVFLIDAARQSEFSRVRSLSDLRRYIAIQGKGWGDVDTLRHSGITVRIGPYKSLFRMTGGGRADYFPRAAFEAIREQEQHKVEVPNLAVEQTLVLKYPFTLAFYVNRNNSKLRDDVERGLNVAWNDGSYQKMFLADPDVRSTIEHADLKQRNIIEIENPTMPPEIASIDPKYFFRP